MSYEPPAGKVFPSKSWRVKLNELRLKAADLNRRRLRINRLKALALQLETLPQKPANPSDV